MLSRNHGYRVCVRGTMRVVAWARWRSPPRRRAPRHAATYRGNYVICNRKYWKRNERVPTSFQSERRLVSVRKEESSGTSPGAMDARTAHNGEDGRTSEEAASSPCLQLDLGDTGSYIYMCVYTVSHLASLVVGQTAPRRVGDPASWRRRRARAGGWSWAASASASSQWNTRLGAYSTVSSIYSYFEMQTFAVGGNRDVGMNNKLLWLDNSVKSPCCSARRPKGVSLNTVPLDRETSSWMLHSTWMSVQLFVAVWPEQELHLRMTTAHGVPLVRSSVFVIHSVSLAS